MRGDTSVTSGLAVTRSGTASEILPQTLSAARDQADLKVGLYGGWAPVAVTCSPV
jgi:hypothetical protein